jgi:hypothetical protein
MIQKIVDVVVQLYSLVICTFSWLSSNSNVSWNVRCIASFKPAGPFSLVYVDSPLVVRQTGSRSCSNKPQKCTKKARASL